MQYWKGNRKQVTFENNNLLDKKKFPKRDFFFRLFGAVLQTDVQALYLTNVQFVFKTIIFAAVLHIIFFRLLISFDPN